MQSKSRVLIIRIQTFFIVGALAILLLAACGSAASVNKSKSASAVNAFPHGITIMVGCSPGCVTDLSARLIAPYLSTKIHVPVNVENVLGGGGNVALEKVCTASPNSGYLDTAYLPQEMIGQIIGKIGCSLSTVKPLADVWGNSTSVMVTRSGGQLSNWHDITSFKGDISIGVVGVKSSAGWLAAEDLALYNHIKVVPVPYSGGPQMVAAVLGGGVDAAMIPVGLAAAPVAAGKLDAPVEFGAGLIKALPSVPSIVKLGGSQNEVVDSLSGFFGAPDMSSAEQQILVKALRSISNEVSFIRASEKIHETVVYQDPKQFETSIQKDRNLILTLKRRLGL